MNKKIKSNQEEKITAARITEMPKTMFDPLPVVMVKVGDSDEEKRLFSYYPDEISFSAEEFVGLTVSQAKDLRHKRDVDYLQS